MPLLPPVTSMVLPTTEYIFVFSDSVCWYGLPEPGNPFLSGLSLADIGTDKCDWSLEDLVAFDASVNSGNGQKWMQEQYDELRQIIHSVPPFIPDNLKGIFEADD